MTMYSPSTEPTPAYVPGPGRLPAELADLAAAREAAYDALLEFEAAEDDVLSDQWRDVAMAKEKARAADAVAKGKDPLKLTGNAVTDAETRRIRAQAAHRVMVQRVREADAALFAGWIDYLREHGDALMDSIRQELATAADAYVEAQRAANAARDIFGLTAGWLALVGAQRQTSMTEHKGRGAILDNSALRGSDEISKVYDLLELIGLDPRSNGAASGMVKVRFPDGRVTSVAPNRVAGAVNLGAVVVAD